MRTWMFRTVPCDRHVLLGIVVTIPIPQFPVYTNQLLSGTIYARRGGAGTAYYSVTVRHGGSVQFVRSCQV
jgi:hypothetical protein